MEKVSVIIPVYNAEKYIQKCLCSVFAQDYENLEIIVINDGSTDRTDEIIKKYEGKIKYIKKENTGVADTRNIGIENATGKYIMFVDADDYIHKDLLKNLKKYISKNIDLIKYKAYQVTQDGEIINKLDGPIFEAVKGDEAFSLLCFEDKLIDVPWLYLYKKEIFTKNEFKFSEGLYHEDFGLIPLIIATSEKCVSTDIYGYCYVKSDNSITRNEDYNKTLKKAYDLISHYDNMIQEINKFNISEENEQNIKIFYTNSILLRINDLKKQDRRKFIKELRNRKIQKNIKVKNIKQLIKRAILEISIPIYLKLR